MEGEEAIGVINAIDFLRKINFDEPVELGERVGVIGGGNVAIDAARVAKRLGKDVTIFNVHLDRDEMFAFPEEIKAAVDEEGIKVEFLVAPKKIFTEHGRLNSVEFIKLNRDGEADSIGMRPSLPGTEFTVELDAIMPAIGLKPETGFLRDAGIEITSWGTIVTDDKSLSTNVQGIFACADVVTGPSTVTEAMAAGRKAATSIQTYLEGKEHSAEMEEPVFQVPEHPVRKEELQHFKEFWPLENRVETPYLPDNERLTGFGEVELGLGDADAMREAARCLSCGGCSDCEECIKVCEPGAIDYGMKDEMVEVNVGNIIIATGYQLFDARRAKEYGYKKFDNVLTSLEFERLSSAAGPTSGKILLKNGKEPDSVAILHCIGSRDENYNRHCSRICCMYSLKFAHLVKEKTEAEVYEFYIDMRAFGKGYEEFFERIQKEKVNIIRGKVPEITNFAEAPEERGKLIIQCEDTLLGLNRRIAVDMVVLSVGIEPQADADELAKIFSLSRGSDGFFLEKHPKLDPMATMSDGILIAGCCQGPKDIPDAVAQGSGAAARALSVLTRGEVEIDAITAVIDKDLCSGCKICNNLCPYAAIEFREEEHVSAVVEELCKGCGTCVAACPVSAIKASHFTDEQIFAEIDGLLAV
jgi:heterodisulfide reductase subunit A